TCLAAHYIGNASRANRVPPPRSIISTAAHRPRPSEAVGPVQPSLRLRGAYLIRFHTISTLPPPDPVELAHFSSSPVRVMSRFCSVPSQLGNVLPSILKISVLSASLTEYVPNQAMPPSAAALFSSAVPSLRLLDANFRRSSPTDARPLPSSVRMPF